MSQKRSIESGIAGEQRETETVEGHEAGASLRRTRLGLLAAFGLALLAAAPATALTLIDFDSLPSLSDVATAPLPGVSVSSALLVSEADAALLTGFDTSEWATSGTQGLLNVYGGGVLSIDFAQAITSFGIRLLALPSDLLVPTTVTLSFFEGARLWSSIDLTATGADLPDGFRRVAYDVALVSGTITRAVLSPDSGDPTSFFVDDLSFTPVPEPGTALLLAVALSALVAVRRAR